MCSWMCSLPIRYKIFELFSGLLARFMVLWDPTTELNGLILETMRVCQELIQTDSARLLEVLEPLLQSYTN